MVKFCSVICRIPWVLCVPVMDKLHNLDFRVLFGIVLISLLEFSKKLGFFLEGSCLLNWSAGAGACSRPLRIISFQ